MPDGEKKCVSVLMYHALEDEAHPAGTKDAGEQRYVLQVSQFRDQMEYLHREGYRTFLLEELHALVEWPDKAVVITFDDGHESNFTLALPILQEFAFKAEFFITTGWIGTSYFMNEEQIRELHKAGMGFGSHGVSHSFLDDLDIRGMEQELFESRDRLSDLIGGMVDSFAAPGGRTHKDVVNSLRKFGYKSLFTSKPGLLFKGGSLFDIPRIPVCADTNVTSFVSMMSADVTYISKMQRRNALLRFMKSVLGNRLYQNVRNILLGG